MSIIVTGVAGFIGMHTAQRLLERGEHVVGIDSINNYYDPALKYARLKQLQNFKNFHFKKLDFADITASKELIKSYPNINQVIHMGAQAGVRNSIEQPTDYLHSNLSGQLTILELCRALMERQQRCIRLIYASSSSVYGSNPKTPFSTGDRTDRPASFYGATKKAGEMMAHAYSDLYNIPSIGLRFFTVYGPWGRPDMSPYIFTNHILKGEKIPVFNNGNMKRDFTFIDDIVDGILSALDLQKVDTEFNVPHKIYNLGNNKSVKLMDYINVIEKACGKKANIKFLPIQPGDVLETYADISQSTEELGFLPRTSIEVGIPNFVNWFREYHNI